MLCVLNVAAIEFPVLCFSGSLVYAMPTPDVLTTCTKVALRNGYFDNLLIVDANGIGYWVKGARKLHGVGRFFGYNIFLNQRIKVDLLTDGTPIPVSLDEVKRRVLQSFKDWHGWESTGEVEELREKVTTAQSIVEVQRLIA